MNQTDLSRSWRRRAGAALAVLAVSGTAAACSQDKPAVCTQVDAVQSSLHDLRNTSISENGLGSISAALNEVRNELRRLSDQASTQFQPQIAAVRTAVDQLQLQVSLARSAPSAQSLGRVGVALGGAQAAVQDLAHGFSNTC